MFTDTFVNFSREKASARIFSKDENGEFTRIICFGSNNCNLNIMFDEHNKWLEALNFFDIELVLDSRNDSLKEIPLSEFIDEEFARNLKP